MKFRIADVRRAELQHVKRTPGVGRAESKLIAACAALPEA